MAVVFDLLGAILDAKERNSTLAHSDLRHAARATAKVAYERGLELVACDQAGERVIGAALGLDDRIVAADRSRRLDGLRVLLVSGRVAGSAGIAQQARLIRNLGADTVEVAVLDGWGEPILGCDKITPLFTNAPTQRLTAHSGF